MLNIIELLYFTFKKVNYIVYDRYVFIRAAIFILLSIK